ncbi:MAG: ribosome small subunit-dependent GTPase A [Clostridia bacterium]|nr:ribosome small subunit-dependent GTPase A [Clostridia bacterium]
MQGLIIGNISNSYKIKTDEKIYEAYARGKLKNEEITPLVGDKVEIEITDEEKCKAVIESILPRNNEIKRPKMANIDQIIFIVSTKNPKPDLLMLDKQLAYVEKLKIEPVIIINKIDLEDTYKGIQELYSNIGYRTIVTSAKQGLGIEDVKSILKNKISVFSGNSGVGKSSIINAIFGGDKTQEGEISQKNKKGKNTTTDTKLYELEKNTYIADTPGFSSFEISEIESTELDKYFREFVQEIENCEFVGCTHIKENACGIKEAILNGKISQERYERFCKIYEELKEQKRKKGPGPKLRKKGPGPFFIKETNY